MRSRGERKTHCPQMSCPKQVPFSALTSCCRDYGLGEVLPSPSGSRSKRKHYKEEGRRTGKSCLRCFLCAGVGVSGKHGIMAPGRSSPMETHMQIT